MNVPVDPRERLVQLATKCQAELQAAAHEMGVAYPQGRFLIIAELEDTEVGRAPITASTALSAQTYTRMLCDAASACMQQAEARAKAAQVTEPKSGLIKLS